MTKGWGYKANRRSQDKIAVDGLTVKFESEKMKVYESLDNLFYGGKLNIIILFNKEKNTIKAILTGKDLAGTKVKPIEKDIANLKTLSKIKEYLLNNLINEFKKLMIGFDNKEIEEMTNKEFKEALDNFINCDIKVMSRDGASNLWRRFYKDMFERTSLYDDFEIILVHNRYLKAMNQTA